MRKKMLEKRLAKLETKRQSLGQRALESQDAAEVRSLNDQIADINEQVEDIREEISVIEAEEAEKKAEEARAAEAEVENRGVMPQVNGNIVNAYSQGSENREDPYASMEYRMAFKDYVQKGIAIPSNFAQRSEVASTKGIGAIIPTTVLNEVIKNLQGIYGNLYAKVRKMNVPGGVKIPLVDVNAELTWINESTVSKDQDGVKSDAYIEFSYNIGEVRIAETLLASIVALPVFEQEITNAIVGAYLKAMDQAIVNGSGNGAPLGLLKDPRVLAQTDHIIEMTAAEFTNWTQWRKKFFKVLPLSKRSGEFCFPISTVESNLLTMADSNNNPIFHQATGAEIQDKDGSTYGRFFGREVNLVEPDIIPDFDSAQAGDVVGLYFTPNDYIINSNLQFGIRRYTDENTNKIVNKAIIVCDGKPADVSGVYLIVKK